MGKPYVRSVTTLDSLAISEKIICIDDFEGSLCWTYAGTGTPVCVLDSVLPYRGAGFLYFSTRTTSVSVNDEVTVTRDIPTIILGKIKTSFYFFIDGVQDKNQYEFWLNFYTGDYLVTPKFKYDSTDGKFYYSDSGGSYVELDGRDYGIVYYPWNFIEFTVDLNTLSYVSFRFNTITVDMAGIALPNSANTGFGGNINFKNKIISAAATEARAGLDDLIVTTI